MTLDELLLEWSYRSEKGYPCLDSPSDILMLKSILKELNIPSKEIIQKIKEQDITVTTDDEIEGFNDAPSNISDAKQNLIDLIDDTTEPVLDLSSKELKMISIRLSDESNLEEDTDFMHDLGKIKDYKPKSKDQKEKIEDTEEGVINQIKRSSADPELIKRLSAEILGSKYRTKIYDYFALGGKALLQKEVFGVAFESMKQSGDIVSFVKYIQNPISFREAYPENSGDLLSPFEKNFTRPFLQTLLELDKGYSGISVGKGEYFLTLMCSDIYFDSPYETEGDLVWGQKGLEVKNAGAKPTGQKASYGPNSHEEIFKDAVNFINNSSVDPLIGKDSIPTSKFNKLKDWMKSIKGRWPYKIAWLYENLSEENKTPFIEKVNSGFNNAYKGLPDMKELNLNNYIEGNTFNAYKFELDWSTSVVKDYQNNHKFDYVLFLNSKDGKGGYELVDSENVHPNLSIKGAEEPSSITIWAQDGLPRWTATSVA